MTRIFATFESIVNDDPAGKGGLSPWDGKDGQDGQDGQKEQDGQDGQDG